MIDFYEFHKVPNTLYGYDIHEDKLPQYVWKSCKIIEYFDIDGKKLTREMEWSYCKTTWNEVKAKKYEKLWVMSAHEAYKYAVKILKGRFKAGEDIIAKDPLMNEYYQFYIKNGQELIKGYFYAPYIPL